MEELLGSRGLKVGELPGAVAWVGGELAVDSVHGGPSGSSQRAAGPGPDRHLGRVAPLGSGVHTSLCSRRQGQRSGLDARHCQGCSHLSL